MYLIDFSPCAAKNSARLFSMKFTAAAAFLQPPSDFILLYRFRFYYHAAAADGEPVRAVQAHRLTQQLPLRVLKHAAAERVGRVVRHYLDGALEDYPADTAVSVGKVSRRPRYLDSTLKYRALHVALRVLERGIERRESADDVVLELVGNHAQRHVIAREDDKLDVALDVIKKAKENGVNLVLGTDSICGDDFKNDCNTQVCPSNNIPDGWEGMDAGPETRKAFAAAIKGAKTILWNGPAGVFEFDNFAGGSKAIADAIAEATKEGAFSLIGGGDSVACINKFGLADQVSYISTGGGALLEAIEGKVLPGVAAIEK